jgi:phosphate transport system permease protein
MTNIVMLSLTGICTFLVVSALLAILLYLLWRGASALNLDFFTKLPAPVGEPGGGVRNSIFGTLKLIVLASAIGVPIGLLGGIYLSEFSRNWPGHTVRYSADLLNGVPSVVTGIFVYTIVVLPMHRFSTLAGAIALSIIMIPIVLRSTEDFLQAVPRSLREGGLALGASKSETIFTIVLPAAMYGILTGILLAVARIAGETAPLLFTAFGNQFDSPGWLAPTASLPVTIYNYAISPYPSWHRQAWASGFVLLAGLLLLSGAARYFLARGRKRSQG